MKNEHKRHAAITIEYLILLLLVIGVGASMLGLQDTVKNYVITSSDNIKEYSSANNNQSQENNKVTGNLINANENTSNDQKDDSSLIEQELLAKQSLNDYTWSELKTIADDLSTNGEQSVYYEKAHTMMLSKQVKDLDVGDWGKIQVRIIGICQDQKSDGSGSAGLTFQSIYALSKALPLGCVSDDLSDYDSDYVSCWSDSTFRLILNGEIFDNLPSDLQSCVTPVNKYSNRIKLTSKYSTYNKTVEETSDSLFVASSMEYYGTIPRYSTIEQAYYNNEGTGENHDEQYLLYKEEGLCWDDETNMEKTFPDDLSENTGVYFTKTIDGELPQGISTEDWTVSLVRSQTYYFQFYTWGIEDDGFSSSQISYKNYCAVTPCFCL